MHFQRLDGCDQHYGVWLQAGFAALDVEKLLRAKIGTETRLGDDIVAKFQGCLGRDD